MKFIEEYGDVVNENDLRDYRKDRYSYVFRNVILFGGVLFTFLALLIRHVLAGRVGLSIGLALMFLGALSVYFVKYILEPSLRSLENEYSQYLEAKRKLKEK